MSGFFSTNLSLAHFRNSLPSFRPAADASSALLKAAGAFVGVALMLAFPASIHAEYLTQPLEQSFAASPACLSLVPKAARKIAIARATWSWISSGVGSVSTFHNL